MNAPVQSDILTRVHVDLGGDFGKLKPEERTQAYLDMCHSLGLNPNTQPFSYIKLNGKLRLYALKDATDQLRALRKVSVVDMTESNTNGVFAVTVKVQDGEGRTDMAKGAVNIGNLKGDNLANALMKAETKAKRRATLSICGLGMLDETEIETIPGAEPERPNTPAPTPAADAMQPQPMQGPVDNSRPHTLEAPEFADKDGVLQTNWVGWGQLLVERIKGAGSNEEVDRWVSLNKEAALRMKSEAPRVHERVVAAVKARREALQGQPQEEVSDADGRGAMETPDEWLDGLEEKLGTTKDEAGAQKVWDEIAAPNLGRAFPPDIDAAKKMFTDRCMKLAS